MFTTPEQVKLAQQQAIDSLPPRPSEHKTAEDFARERKADEISATEQAKRFGVPVAEMETWIKKHEFPEPVRIALVGSFVRTRRETYYSRSAVARWRAEILSIAAKLK
jgi:hypothetical protein